MEHSNNTPQKPTDEELKIMELKLKEPIRIILTHADAMYMLLGNGGPALGNSMIDEMQDLNLGHMSTGMGNLEWSWNEGALSKLSTLTIYEIYKACRNSREKERSEVPRPKKSDIILTDAPVVDLRGNVITKKRRK